MIFSRRISANIHRQCTGRFKKAVQCVKRTSNWTPCSTFFWIANPNKEWSKQFLTADICWPYSPFECEQFEAGVRNSSWRERRKSSSSAISRLLKLFGSYRCVGLAFCLLSLSRALAQTGSDLNKHTLGPLLKRIDEVELSNLTLRFKAPFKAVFLLFCSRKIIINDRTQSVCMLCDTQVRGKSVKFWKPDHPKLWWKLHFGCISDTVRVDFG